MTTVSGSFSAKGVSDTLALGATLEEITYTFSGTFSGTVQLERAMSTAGTAWEIVAGPFSIAAGGRYQARAQDRVRVRCASYVSGTINYSIADGAGVISRQFDLDGNIIYLAVQGTHYFFGDIVASGSVNADEVSSNQVVLPHGTISSGGLAINSDTARVHTATLGQASTALTLSASLDTGLYRSVMIFLTQGSGGNKSATFPASFRWQGGFSPSLSTAAGATDIIQAITVDGGATWIAGISYQVAAP